MANLSRESDPLLFIGSSSSDDVVDSARESDALDRTAPHDERMRPTVAGGLVGFAGGAAAFALIHQLHGAVIAKPILASAAADRVDPAVSYAIAYVTVAAFGALIGGVFASLTQNLKKLVPLFIWAQLFFLSLTTIIVAGLLTYAKGTAGLSSGAVFGATAIFATFLVLSLPLRLRK